MSVTEDNWLENISYLIIKTLNPFYKFKYLRDITTLNSSVSVVTRSQAVGHRNQKYNPRRIKKFSLLHSHEIYFKADNLYYPVETWVHDPWLRWPERELHNLLPSKTQVKILWDAIIELIQSVADISPRRHGFQYQVVQTELFLSRSGTGTGFSVINAFSPVVLVYQLYTLTHSSTIDAIQRRYFTAVFSDTLKKKGHIQLHLLSSHGDLLNTRINLRICWKYV